MQKQSKNTKYKLTHKSTTVKKKKRINSIKNAINQNVYFLKVRLTTNNLIVTVTTYKHKTITTLSNGHLGFKGSKRSKSFATEVLIKRLHHILRKNKINYLVLQFKGMRPGRKFFYRRLDRRRFKLLRLIYLDKLPHNGCRKRKKRRK